MAAGGGQAAVLVDLHQIQLVQLDVLQIGVEAGIHQLQHLVRNGSNIGLVVVVRPAVDAGPPVGQGHKVHILHAQAAHDGLLGKPSQVVHRQAAVGVHVIQEDLGHFGDGAEADAVEALLNDRLQKGLLGLDAAQIAVGVAAVYVSIGVGVLPPAQKLHGLVAVDVLEPGVQVDVQVLGGVVVVHVDGHIKLYAADGIHQLAHRLPLHHDGVVRLKPDEVGDLLLEKLDAVLIVVGRVVVYRVDALDVPRHVHHGVPGDAHDV